MVIKKKHISMVRIMRITWKIMLLSAILFLWSYKNNAQNRAIDYGNIASVPEGMAFNDTILSGLNVKQGFYKEAPKLVYYFNGDCASCIAAFLSFFKEWQQLEMVMPAFFIASAPNLDILSYYMERADLKPQKSLQFLLLDNQDLIKKYNPYMNRVKSTIYVLLVDENNNVIESKNPFVMKNAMLKYKQTDSKYRLTYKVTGVQPQMGSKPRSILDMIDENAPPLIMINEKECSLDKLKEVIEKITEWSYIEGASAVILYGNKGKKGVFVVRTK